MHRPSGFRAVAAKMGGQTQLRLGRTLPTTRQGLRTRLRHSRRGRIEEITTTYVIVAIWDQRRLIVPLSYFIENPFQNWTRSTSDLLGTAFLYVDYSVSVEALRQEFRRELEESSQWDKRVCALQVTSLSEHTMEIRCLFSAADSGRQFDLRCIVREKMVSFIRQNYPDAFPRMRFSAVSSRSAGGGSSPIPPPSLYDRDGQHPAL